MSADSSSGVLAFLKERWRRPLDITTIGQAQAALGHEADEAVRWRLYEVLQAEPQHLAEKRRYGVSAATVALTNGEKLAGRALLLGAGEDDARRASGIAKARWPDARQALTRVGLLVRGGWRLADGHQRLLDGVGLIFHTVSVRGETFNVP